MKNTKIKNHALHIPECRARLTAIEDSMYVIGGKWKLRVIVALSEKPLRFNELQRTVNGISAKVLSNELKDLEQNGFLKRNVIMGNPITVEYEKMPYTKTLEPLLTELVKWGIAHRKTLIKKSKG